MEVCGRAAVRKSSQICPKSPIYIGGGRGTLPWVPRDPQGVGRARGEDSPPQTESYLVWWEGVLPPSHFFPFFLFPLIFSLLAHRGLVGCPTSPLRAGVTPPNAYGLPRSGLPPSDELPEPIRHSRYIPGNSENLPVIK